MRPARDANSIDAPCLSGVARMLILLMSRSRDAAIARAITAKPALEGAYDFYAAALERKEIVNTF